MAPRTIMELGGEPGPNRTGTRRRRSPSPGRNGKRARVDGAAGKATSLPICHLDECTRHEKKMGDAEDIALEYLLALPPEHPLVGRNVKQVLDWAGDEQHFRTTIHNPVHHLMAHVANKIHEHKYSIDHSAKVISGLCAAWVERVLQQIAGCLDANFGLTLPEENASFTSFEKSEKYKIELKITPIHPFEEMQQGEVQQPEIKQEDVAMEDGLHNLQIAAGAAPQEAPAIRSEKVEEHRGGVDGINDGDEEGEEDDDSDEEDDDSDEEDDVSKDEEHESEDEAASGDADDSGVNMDEDQAFKTALPDRTFLEDEGMYPRGRYTPTLRDQHTVPGLAHEAQRPLFPQPIQPSKQRFRRNSPTDTILMFKMPGFPSRPRASRKLVSRASEELNSVVSDALSSTKFHAPVVRVAPYFGQTWAVSFESTTTAKRFVGRPFQIHGKEATLLGFDSKPSTLFVCKKVPSEIPVESVKRGISLVSPGREFWLRCPESNAWPPTTERGPFVAVFEEPTDLSQFSFSFERQSGLEWRATFNATQENSSCKCWKSNEHCLLQCPELSELHYRG